MSDVWLIRNDALDDELGALGVITIGWDHVADLRSFAENPAGLAETLRVQEPDKSKVSLAMAAGTLQRFADRITIGDVVVAPRRDGVHLRIGTVTSDYFYDAGAPTHRHRRRVTWDRTSVRRDDLPLEARRGLKSIGTLSQINHGTELFRRLASDPDFVLSPESTLANSSPDSPSTWLVGSRIDNTDLTDQFVADGIWRLEGGLDGRSSAIAPGDRIAIKAAFVRYSDLPFDNRGLPVSVMSIKARGRVIATHTDRIDVDWDTSFTPREWYFYTFQGAVWRLRHDDDYAQALHRFVFDDAPQDIGWFLTQSIWTKYADTDDDEDTTPDLLTFLWVGYGQGSSGQAPPRVSSAIAISASGVWNP